MNNSGKYNKTPQIKRNLVNYLSLVYGGENQWRKSNMCTLIKNAQFWTTEMNQCQKRKAVNTK